jgi:hypothetical protein
MVTRSGAVGCWLALGCLVWCNPVHGQTNTRFHIGLDATLYNYTKTDATIAAPTTSSSSSTSTSNSSTTITSKSRQFGLPSAVALSVGALFKDHIDAGLRFEYSNRLAKSGIESLAVETEVSTYALNPYLAYHSGSQSSTNRFVIGVTAGLGSTTSKATVPVDPANSRTTDPSTSESTTGTKQFGAFIGWRWFPFNRFSFDPTFALMKNYASLDSGGSSHDLSGVTYALIVGFTLWSPPATGALSSTTPPETKNAAEGATPSPALAVGSESASVPAKDAKKRLTLALGDNRLMTLIASDTATTESKVAVVLVERVPNSNVESCDRVVLHVPGQQDISVDGAHATISSGKDQVPILKVMVPHRDLLNLAESPRSGSSTAADQWLELCGQNWPLRGDVLDSLREYLGALSAPTKKPSTADSAASSSASGSTPADPAGGASTSSPDKATTAPAPH